jgi:hypothetical protein
VPPHIVVALAAILKLGVTFGLITAVTAFEVAVVVLAQIAFEVSTQVTIAPFAKVELTKVALFVPAFTPFTFHW